MKIAIIAPSPVPFTIGGAEKLFWGLLDHLNQHTSHQAELIRIPTFESDFKGILRSYRVFAELDLNHFDQVISTKYPTWMVSHPNHTCYMLHKLRVLYDLYNTNELAITYQTDYPVIRELQTFMQQAWGCRSALAEFFQRAESLLYHPDLPPDALQFPGPFVREIVRFLDDIGLQKEAIRKYAAISARVASRTDYFPPKARVEVIHPPSTLQGFHCQPGTYLFTASRLEGHKRVGLLIEAMAHVKSPISLKIAGVGPEAGVLQQMAAPDPRIQFLGFVPDDELVDLYAGALAVLFAPYDEDYGLVPIEAMLSGKPVITTRDAGGPTEIISSGETGYVVLPHPEAIAEQIDYLYAHPEKAATMGQQARRQVQYISWQRTIRQLLSSSSSGPANRPKRPKMTIAATYGIYPPQGGGQSRVFHLYRHLAHWFDIELVSITDSSLPAFNDEIAPGLREIRIPKSPKHQQAEWEIEQAIGMPVSDVTLPLLYALTPSYGASLAASAESAQLLVASRPYLLPALRSVSSLPFWYETHDVESRLKQDMFPENDKAQELLALTQQVEADCCRLSQLIMVCSQEDGQQLQSLYGLGPDKLIEVPNGVDSQQVSYVSPRRRQKLKQQFGFSGKQLLTLFMGSWHGPNLEAVEFLLRVAKDLPQITFLFMGSVGLAFRNKPCPPNAHFMGVVDEETKVATLSLIDVALNPMRYGSGTNLKMLDYFAAGVPVISTPFGVRGLGIDEGRHCTIADLEQFPQAILRFAGEPMTEIHQRSERARHYVQKTFDWAVIAQKFYTRYRVSFS